MVAVRLADLLAGLSRFADLGFGLPAGAALRSCALATRVARSLDLSAADTRAAFYTALLQHVGCPGYAYETAQLFGDELSRRTAEHHVDHIYTKIGRTGRAAATLFAVEHHLLDRDG